MPLRAVLYGRISRERGRTKDGTLRSDAMQEDSTTEKARQMGARVVSWDLDMDVSGGLFKRPGFQRALDMFRNGEADVMIAPAMDRFGRDMKVIYKALELIEDAGGYLVTVADGIEDSRTDHGRQQVALYGMFAQTQLDRIKSGWRSAHARHIADGIPSRVAWGYERDNNRRLTPTPIGSTWVPRVFVWRGEGKSLRAITDRLNAAGVSTRTGGRWTDDSIAVVLANRAYLGEVAYGDLVNPNAHPPLVTVAAWHAAQVARPTRTRGDKPQGLLTGLIRCAACRYVMDTKQREPAVYQCGGNHGAGRCPAPVTISAAHVERYVREWAQAQANGLGIAQSPTAAPPELLRAGDEARAAVELFYADVTREARMGSERYRAQEAGLLAHERETQEAIAAYEAGEASAPVLLEGLWSRPIAEQRAALASGIACVFVRGRPGRGRRVPVEGRVHVCTRQPEDLPRRGDGGERYVIREFVFPDDDEAPAGVLAG